MKSKKWKHYLLTISICLLISFSCSGEHKTWKQPNMPKVVGYKLVHRPPEDFVNLPFIVENDIKELTLFFDKRKIQIKFTNEAIKKIANLDALNIRLIIEDKYFTTIQFIKDSGVIYYIYDTSAGINISYRKIKNNTVEQYFELLDDYR